MNIVRPVIVLLLWIAGLAAVHASELETAALETFQSMLDEPRADYNLAARLTSSGPDYFSVTLVTLEKRIRTGVKTYRLVVGNGAGRLEYCLVCGPDGKFLACEGGTAPLLPRDESRIPGTRLPWIELTGNFCLEWRLQPLPGLPPGPLRVEILPLQGPRPANPQIAELDRVSGQPQRIIRRAVDGRPQRIVEILETGSLSSLQGIRRSLVRSDRCSSPARR